MCSVPRDWLYWSVVYIKTKWRGSFTVEATVVVSITCIIIGMVIMFGMYGHDRSVMQSIANQMVQEASLWSGRYVLPEIDEVDYIALKENAKTDLDRIENLGYRSLQNRLLCADLQSVQVNYALLSNDVRVEIIAAFHIGKYRFTTEIQASCKKYESEDLPRKKNEQRESY